MLTGQVYVSSPDSALSRYSWSDMCNLVSEQVSAQISELNRANERVSASNILTVTLCLCIPGEILGMQFLLKGTMSLGFCYFFSKL